ncbi:hypothetical protein LLB_0291 [Legionella longbeachae D-4968]|nr:hypothetical protein LLB_0291 [Legionella longbeachae D-4968]
MASRSFFYPRKNYFSLFKGIGKLDLHKKRYTEGKIISDNWKLWFSKTHK